MTKKNPETAANQNTEGLTMKIGKTTFIVNVKQSETAKKPIDSVFRNLCIHETMAGVLPQNDDGQNNLEKIQKIS